MIEELDTTLVGEKSKGEIKDGIEVIKERNKRAEEKAQAIKKLILEEEKIQREKTEKESKRLKREQSRNKWMRLVNSLKVPFLPDTWINVFQYYEKLLFTMFIDMQIILVLFSLVYILYIIIIFTGDQLVEGIFKVAGCMIICLLILAIQVFTPTSKKEE